MVCRLLFQLNSNPHTDMNLYIGCKISDEHYEELIQSPVLTQEFHAMAFASESIRSIDLTNCMGVLDNRSSQMRGSTDFGTYRRISSEILRPILMLARAGLCTCHSINMSGNPLSPVDIDELGTCSSVVHSLLLIDLH